MGPLIQWLDKHFVDIYPVLPGTMLGIGATTRNQTEMMPSFKVLEDSGQEDCKYAN